MHRCKDVILTVFIAKFCENTVKMTSFAKKQKPGRMRDRAPFETNSYRATLMYRP